LLIKSYVEEVMYGRRRSFVLGVLLSVLAVIYGAVIRLRSLLYRTLLLRGRSLPCKVISIGNITLGGTGKTPTVISVAGFLAANRKRPVVVSRGYGRKNESEILVVSDGSSILADARSGGDEPLLIAAKLPGIPVVVGSRRYQAALHAVRAFNSSVVVLDDGFQHRQLKRDLDIVLVDATDPFGNGKLFPAGILREPISVLKRAHAVVITRSDQTNDLHELTSIIGSITHARIFTSLYRPVDLVDCNTGDVKPLSALRGARTLAFSGIARPASFTALLGSLGADIVAESAFPDHYPYTRSDLAELFKKAADARVSLIITSEKDMVRIRDLKPEGIWALRIELVVQEREAWEAFLMRHL
jgi:tetraacyldisaccharide 4'-kinase